MKIEDSKPEAKQEPEPKVTRETPRTKLARVVEQPAAPEPEPEPVKAISPEPDPEPEPQPAVEVKQTPKPEPAKSTATPHARLAALMDSEGFTEEVTLKTLREFFPRQARVMTSLDAIPEQVLNTAFSDADAIEEFTETLRANSK